MVFPLLIKRISEDMRKAANSDLQELDLTLSQHHTILYLSQCPERTCELKALEKSFCVAQATMAGIVQRLEAKGYVEALSCPTDRRVKLLRLTDEGAELSRKSVERLRYRQEKMMRGLTEEEQDTLKSLLERVYRNLQDEEDSPPTGKETQ